jgi:hypothetical protein
MLLVLSIVVAVVAVVSLVVSLCVMAKRSNELEQQYLTEYFRSHYGDTGYRPN